MNIHAPVLIQTANGFTFGVVLSKTTTETAKEKSSKFEVFQFGSNCSVDHDEQFVSALEQPSQYDFGMRAKITAHPGIKWAFEESERRKNEPELPLAVESIPASINLPTQ